MNIHTSYTVIKTAVSYFSLKCSQSVWVHAKHFENISNSHFKCFHPSPDKHVATFEMIPVKPAKCHYSKALCLSHYAYNNVW